MVSEKNTCTNLCYIRIKSKVNAKTNSFIGLLNDDIAYR